MSQDKATSGPSSESNSKEILTPKSWPDNKTYYQDMLSELDQEIFKNQAQITAILKIKHYIEHNFESNINLDELAQVHGISKYHLLRLFKKYFGQTPRQFLRDIRIENAKKHLKQGMSVTESCFAVGFESLGSYSRLFKTKTGKTPVQYRKEQFSTSKDDQDI